MQPLTPIGSGNILNVAFGSNSSSSSGVPCSSSSTPTSTSNVDSSSSISSSSSHSSSILAPETSSNSSTLTLFSSPAATISCTSDYNSSSSPRPPLASISNCLPDSTPNSGVKSLLRKHLLPVTTNENTTKTGRAKALTSTECMEIMAEKERQKEQAAMEKQERKIERERKKVEKEQLSKRKREEREKKQEANKRRKEATAGKCAATKKCHKASSGGTRAASVASLVASSTIDPQPNTLAQPSTTDDDCECSFCYGSYCEDGEEWVRGVDAGCTRDIIWKKSFLMMMAKSAFAHFVLTKFSYHNFFCFFHVMQKTLKNTMVIDIVFESVP